MVKVSAGKSIFTNLTANSVKPEYASLNIIPDQGKIETVDFDLLQEEIKDWSNDIETWWKNKAAPFIEDLSKKTEEVLENTAATISTGIVSLVEGVGQFGEAVVDLAAIAGTGLVSVGTGLYDGYQALKGTITGEEWESATKKMWGETKDFVATEHVKSKFDEFYENNEFGQWMKENAYGFDTVRGIGSGIGYVAGVIGVSLLTFGLGGAAIGGTSAAAGTVTAGQLATTAGLTGFSRGTERAWVNGADIVEGLEYGALSGIWEGLQFYVGGKISAPGGFGDQIASKFANNSLLAGSLARISLDGATGGAEGFMQPLLDLVYKDSYTDANGKEVKFDEDMTFKEKYKEAFDDAGGWQNVGIQTVIGTGMSSFGEFGNLRNILAPEGNNKIQIEKLSDEIYEEININKNIVEDNIKVENKKINNADIKTKGCHYIQKEDKNYEIWDDYLYMRKIENNPDYQKIIDSVNRISKDEKNSIFTYQSDEIHFSYMTQNALIRDTFFELAPSGKIENISLREIYSDKSNKQSINSYINEYKDIYGEEKNSKEIMNEILKHNKQDILNIITAMENSKLRKNMVLYRGETTGNYFQKKYNIDITDEEQIKELIGKQYITTSITSTSITSKTKPIKNAKIVYELFCEENINAVHIHEIDKSSLSVTEQEILVGPEIPFEIFEVKKNNNQIIISLKTSELYDSKKSNKIFKEKIEKKFAEYEELVNKTFTDEKNTESIKVKEFNKIHDLSNYINEEFESLNILTNILNFNKKKKEIINIYNNRINTSIKNGGFDSSGYYELLKLVSDIDSVHNPDIITETINSNIELRKIISTEAEQEIKYMLKTMFEINDEKFAKQLTDCLLGGETFINDGVGNGINWDNYIKLMKDNYKKRMEKLINEGKEPVIWGSFDDEYHHAMNEKYTTIENVMLGENVYFLDAVYPNWNQNYGIKLEDLWGKLSAVYAEHCCDIINPKTGENFTSISFLYPKDKKMDDCFGNLFKTVELPEILSDGTIETIKMTKVDPENMNKIEEVEIDITDIAEYYDDELAYGKYDEKFLAEECFQLFLEKVKKEM